jgi:hypothetical protein
LISLKRVEGGAKLGRVMQLIKTNNIAACNDMHNSGVWTDLEMVVASTKGPDGNTWHCTAMAWAAFNHQLKILRWLIEKGGKVNEGRAWHQLPSNAAASAGFIEGLELLKYKGCDLSKANSEGSSPVHCAAIVGHLPTLRLLHSWGVPMNVKNYFGRTPAHYTAEKGHAECSAFFFSARSGVRK